MHKSFALIPILISTGHNEPAGLCFNERDQILAVPNYGSHTVDFISLAPFSTQSPTSNIVNSFYLGQNFPNPFNPKTTIKYHIRQFSQVSLKIFNVLGQEIITLVDADKKAGKYEVNWNSLDANGNTVVSGVYIYQLKTEYYNESKKMILMR